MRRLRKFYDFFRYDLHQGIGKLVEWFPIIWKDRDWDQYYLWVMLEKKLWNMSVLQRDYGNCVDHLQAARDLAVAAEYCRRLAEDHLGLEKVWVGRGNGITLIGGCTFRSELSTHLYLEILANLIRRKSRTWWD